MDELILRQIQQSIETLDIEDKLWKIFKIIGLRREKPPEREKSLPYVKNILVLTARQLTLLHILGEEKAFKIFRSQGQYQIESVTEYNDLVLEFISMVLDYTAGAIDLLRLAQILDLDTSPEVLKNNPEIVRIIMEEDPELTQISELSESLGITYLEAIVALYKKGQIKMEPKYVECFIIDLMCDCNFPNYEIFTAMSFSIIQTQEE
jgi:hypothetical protein